MPGAEGCQWRAVKYPLHMYLVQFKMKHIKDKLLIRHNIGVTAASALVHASCQRRAHQAMFKIVTRERRGSLWSEFWLFLQATTKGAHLEERPQDQNSKECLCSFKIQWEHARVRPDVVCHRMGVCGSLFNRATLRWGSSQ